MPPCQVAVDREVPGELVEVHVPVLERYDVHGAFDPGEDLVHSRACRSTVVETSRATAASAESTALRPAM